MIFLKLSALLILMHFANTGLSAIFKKKSVGLKVFYEV